jgi:hypothetical protein
VFACFTSPRLSLGLGFILTLCGRFPTDIFTENAHSRIHKDRCACHVQTDFGSEVSPEKRTLLIHKQFASRRREEIPCLQDTVQYIQLNAGVNSRIRHNRVSHSWQSKTSFGQTCCSSALCLAMWNLQHPKPRWNCTSTKTLTLCSCFISEAFATHLSGSQSKRWRSCPTSFSALRIDNTSALVKLDEDSQTPPNSPHPEEGIDGVGISRGSDCEASAFGTALAIEDMDADKSTGLDSKHLLDPRYKSSLRRFFKATAGSSEGCCRKCTSMVTKPHGPRL